MVQQELICKHFKSSNPSTQCGLKLQTACQQLMFSTKRWLISSLPLLNTQSKCLNRRQSEVKTITAKEMVKKFSRNIFQTFRCSENALSIRCTAMLKMKSRWRICAPKFFLLIIHWLPASWSWLAPALRKLCMDSRSWQAARVHKWSSTLSCQGFHKIILHR